MFDKIKRWLRGGLAKLGLINSLKELKEHPDVSENDVMFNEIDVWKALYEGKYGPFHNVTYETIDGTKSRTMMSMNMPKVLSSEMASLIYNEKCEINIDNETVDTFVQDVLKNNKFDKNFQDYLEYAFATGGMAIKPYFDGKRIMLTFIPADSFVPISWKNGNIYEAVIPHGFVERGKHYTHLEWHLWEDGVYVVKNELYESKISSEIGVEVSLSASQRTNGMAPEARMQNIKRSLFTYFRPNTANQIDMKSPLGVSIYSNALDTLKAIDTAFDSFHREFRLGKKRILVPAQYIKTVVDPADGVPKRYFDSTDEVYEAFNGNMDEGDSIKDVSVELRVEEHVAGINALLNTLAMQTGFSFGTFTFEGKSYKTATEVISENSKTFKTKQSHETIIEAGLQELVGSIIALGQLYELTEYTEDYEVSVLFDDSIAVDKEKEEARQIALITAGLQSKRRAIKKLFKASDEEIDKIMQEIHDEQSFTAPDAVDHSTTAFFGSSEG